MRNKYKGICYKCGKTVEAGEGHFESNKNNDPNYGKWRLIHAGCVFKQREEKRAFARGPKVKTRI